jgi:hypothetical protein
LLAEAAVSFFRFRGKKITGLRPERSFFPFPAQEGVKMPFPWAPMRPEAYCSRKFGKEKAAPLRMSPVKKRVSFHLH